MRVNNSITVQKSGNEKAKFSTVINSPAVRGMIDRSLNNPKRAASFVSTLISSVATNPQLSSCKPESVISAALKGEGMDLSLALGQYSIVPYGDLANFQISYKGMSQLATRSGQYKDFGVFDVREGEFKGKDPRTRQPMIEWKDDDERENLPICGYYGFYELKSGFFKSVYWTHEKILNHADRYSAAFSKDVYMSIYGEGGDIKKAESVKRKSPWYDAPNSEGHMKMCRKTILLQMLGDGVAPLSLEMQNIMSADSAIDKDGIIYADDPMVIAKNNPESVIVDSETGEIIEPESTPEPKRGRRKASVDERSSDDEDLSEQIVLGDIMNMGD